MVSLISSAPPRSRIGSPDPPTVAEVMQAINGKTALSAPIKFVQPSAEPGSPPSYAIILWVPYFNMLFVCFSAARAHRCRQPNPTLYAINAGELDGEMPTRPRHLTTGASFMGDGRAVLCVRRAARW